MCRTAKVALWVVTGIAWAVAGLGIVPGGWDPGVEVTQFALAIAALGTFAIVNDRSQRSVSDVWEAGRARGRREALEELNGRRRRGVASLEQRRRERVSAR